MRQTIYRSVLASVAAGMLASGCVYSHHAAVKQPDTIVVTEKPPPPKVEPMGTAPDTEHAWVPGYWMHSDRHWVWIPGRWEERPKPEAVWVPGHWSSSGSSSWTWTPGHWE